MNGVPIAAFDMMFAEYGRAGVRALVKAYFDVGRAWTPPTTRWRARTVDGRELSTYDARASQAYRRLRAVAPLVAGSFGRCTRPDFASREQLVDVRKAPGS